MKTLQSFWIVLENKNVIFLPGLTVPLEMWPLPPSLTTSRPADSLVHSTLVTLASFLLHSILEFLLASGLLRLLIPLPANFSHWLLTSLALCQPSGLSLNKASFKRPSLNTISKIGPPVALSHDHPFTPFISLYVFVFFFTVCFPHRNVSVVRTDAWLSCLPGVPQSLTQ